jgi:hypothetical protein
VSSLLINIHRFQLFHFYVDRWKNSQICSNIKIKNNSKAWDGNCFANLLKLFRLFDFYFWEFSFHDDNHIQKVATTTTSTKTTAAKVIKLNFEWVLSAKSDKIFFIANAQVSFHSHLLPSWEQKNAHRCRIT